MKRTVINRAKMYHYLVQLVDKKNPNKVHAKWKISTKERMDYRTFILSEPVERRKYCNYKISFLGISDAKYWEE